MQLKQKILSGVLLAGATFVGYLYCSDNAFVGETKGYKVFRPEATPSIQTTGHITRRAQVTTEVATEGDASLAQAPNAENAFSASGSSGRSASGLNSTLSHTANVSYTRKSSQASGGGATFANASFRSSSSRSSASSVSSGSALAVNSLETDLNSSGRTTRSFAPAATTGGMDPGGDPTGPPIPIPDGTAVLLVLAAGYTYWRFRKIKA